MLLLLLLLLLLFNHTFSLHAVQGPSHTWHMSSLSQQVLLLHE
jgi:hypothetical protein